ncbi:MAG TPA: alpha/beta hydrolase [Thermoanaerobaculia bacterium]|nr:alpha/beta hydrolase [Thermoanaerobaculia bacterium]
MAIRRRAPEPPATLLRFEATDGITLSGLLFEPRRASTRAALFLHGTGGSSVFTSPRTNLLASLFTKAGVAYFPFDNRGAQVMRRMGREFGGYAFERIRDCVFDIDGALRELRARGYRDFTLIGHSTGANKIAVYDSLQPRKRVQRYVLLGGGDDTGLLYEQLGPRRYFAALKKARERRNSLDIVPRALSSLPMSWRSFYDMANPNGDYNVFPFLEVLRDVRLSRKPRFRHIRGIRKPALMLYGEHDEYCSDVPRCVAILAENAGPKTELGIIGEADHGFGGHEEELARIILDWME